jgi:hypothetical protein
MAYTENKQVPGLDEFAGNLDGIVRIKPMA